MDSRWSDQDLETGYKVSLEWEAMLFKILHYQECFRVFSKDETGCITAEEMKWVTRVEMMFSKNRTRWKLWLDLTPLTSCFQRTVTNNPETSTIDGAFMFWRGYFCSDFCFITYLKYPAHYKKTMCNPGRDLQHNYIEGFLYVGSIGPQTQTHRQTQSWFLRLAQNSNSQLSNKYFTKRGEEYRMKLNLWSSGLSWCTSLGR